MVGLKNQPPDNLTFILRAYTDPSMSKPIHHSGRSRAMILLIALISFVPFGLAWYYARNPNLITQHNNYGHLIQPARPMGYADLFTLPVTTVEALQEIKGRWVLLQVAPASCQEICRETLYKTRQSQLMLNKEIARVRRLLLVPEGTGTVDLPALLKDDATLLVSGAPPLLMRQLTEAIGQAPNEGMVLLMDPLANVMMWYDANFDPYGLVKDLRHLLKASQIG
jgi:hypothetical protein